MPAYLGADPVGAIKFGSINVLSMYHGEVLSEIDWTPFVLEDKLLAWWSTADLDTISLSGTDVTEWRDMKHGYAMLPSTNQPEFDADGWGGILPCITVAGVDQDFTCTVPAFLNSLPIGAGVGEMWALVRQDALVADATERVVMGYGGGSAFNNARRMTRIVQTSANRARIMTGTGATAVNTQDGTVDFSGQRVLRGQFGATESILTIDTTAVAPLSAVPNTQATRARLFSSSGTTAVSFFNGAATDFVFTTALTADEATALYNYLDSRRAV